MGKKRKSNRQTKPFQKQLRWRITNMRLHRERLDGMTQQKLADALAQQNPPIELDRVSIGRIETGEQLTKIDVIEGISKVLGVDLHSLLNLTPEEAELIQAFQRYDVADQRRILRMMEAGKDNGE